MRKLLKIMRLPDGSEERYRLAHHVWMSLALTLLGCCVGILSLMLGAAAYVKLHGALLFASYFAHPLILFLNLLPPILLIWTFYLLFRRAWVGFLGSFLPVVGAALVNYFKIRLRSDPFLAADLRLASEAKGIIGGYTLDLTWLVWFSLFALIAGLLFTIFLMPRGPRRSPEQRFGALSSAALTAVAFVALFTSPQVYQKAANSTPINPWSDVEVFVSKGCIYPFLYSFRDMLPTLPPEYHKADAAQLLTQYPDSDIPEDQKVSVMGIMLEAFCDLTDFDALSENQAVAQVYAPWHALEEQSVSGDLLTNIFAGGTVDSEWGFLTGYTTHRDFRKDTDSYVWYLRDQGYQTFGSHPGYGWFYNRQNVNRYLGFEEYWFNEGHYDALVDQITAVYHSDHILTNELFQQLQERTADGPCFSFSVSYQNHGPYGSEQTDGAVYLTPEDTGFGAETCNIWNNYLGGISETIDAVTGLTADLETLEEPVVLVLFGDHKPWGGNGNSAYLDLGAAFDLSIRKDFDEYYATPYLIWANSAAKETLGRDFVGEGGDFSPCFLMTEVFDQCGWEGPGFMALSRQLRELTPLVHARGLYLQDDQLTDTLSREDTQFLNQFLGAQYFRENEAAPGR